MVLYFVGAVGRVCVGCARMGGDVDKIKNIKKFEI
jgi:hypothetical protein